MRPQRLVAGERHGVPLKPCVERCLLRGSWQRRRVSAERVHAVFEPRPGSSGHPSQYRSRAHLQRSADCRYESSRTRLHACKYLAASARAQSAIA